MSHPLLLPKQSVVHDLIVKSLLDDDCLLVIDHRLSVTLERLVACL